MTKDRNPAISASAINRYLVRRREDLQVCSDALETCNFKKMGDVAHRIKGSGSTFGFPELSAIAEKLEAATAKSDLAEVKSCFLDFERWVETHQPSVKCLTV
jgi:HPt (histidine-containing phosphotransfer) domain-containing protein